MKHRLRKLTSVVLAVIMVFSVLTIAPFTVSAASFVPRTTAPDTNNAYYYNSAYNPFSRGQCTWYVWGRAFEITGIRPKYSTYPCDGKDVFYNCKSAGYSTGSVPKVGAIACWGASNSTWGYGHVAIVEKIIDGTVYVSEYNRVGSLKFSYNAIPNLPNFIGYVYLGDFSNDEYVDLGTEFYASISHIASWNHLTVEDNGNVDICYETYRANQYWKFYRQYDGSYKIVSAYNGKCLDVYGGSKEDGANVQVYDDNSTDAQRWFVYKCGNGYQLKAKCTDCVMEMNAWNFYQGVNLVAGNKDNSDAEIFAINFKDFNSVGTTNLNISCRDDGYVDFSWTPALCATNYNLKIWNGSSVQPGEAPINLWNVQNNNISVNLGSGKFTAYLESYDAIGDYVQGQPKTFNVEVLEYTPSYSVIYNSHVYSIYNTPTSWEKAKLVCEQKGGHLATITSIEEQNVIEELLNYGNLKYYSLGASNLTSSGNWEWITNEPFDFSNWADGEPNNVLNIENYLSVFNIDAYKGKWNDTSNFSISGLSNGFICEYENLPQNILGDVDNNGDVTIDDVTLIQKYIANMSEFDSEQLKAADVTGDNDISIDDVTAIQKYLAGMITTFANA